MAAIFFDIDGTLWDFHHNVPESTKEAIKLLKENGHLTFLCSGRTKCFAEDPILEAMGFDGGLYGCGTHIEFRGESLFYVEMDHDLCLRATSDFLAGNMPIIQEGRDWLYMDKENISQESYGAYLYENYQHITQPVVGNEDNWKFSKYSVVIEGIPYKHLLEKYDTELEFLVHGDRVMEVLPKGYSKATAIDEVCRQLGISREETYAFGDGDNDLEMLDWVQCGIAMGNGKESAKERADYVTDDIHSDGIYNACRHFGLI